MLSALGHRSVDKSECHVRPQRLQRLTQHVGDAKCFKDNGAQFGKNRRVVIGLVMFLVADAFDGHKAAGFQSRQLALDRTGTGGGQTDYFLGVKRPLCLAK